MWDFAHTKSPSIHPPRKADVSAAPLYGTSLGASLNPLLVSPSGQNPPQVALSVWPTLNESTIVTSTSPWENHTPKASC